MCSLRSSSPRNPSTRRLTAQVVFAYARPMRITGATSNQYRACRLAQSDLVAVGVRLPAKLFIKFDGQDLEQDDLGSHMPYSDGSHVIELSPSLLDGGTYFTLLHEVGHVFGLGHTVRGVMAPRDRSKVRKLTLRNRRRWLGDFVRRLLAKRLETLQ